MIDDDTSVPSWLHPPRGSRLTAEQQAAVLQHDLNLFRLTDGEWAALARWLPRPCSTVRQRINELINI